MLRLRMIILSFFCPSLFMGFLGVSFAQQPDISSAPTAHSEWLMQLDEHTQRQEFREENHKIRAEHEELETERDVLKTQCMDAKGQDQVSCHEKGKLLKQKFDALHERIRILHDKMTAERNAHTTSEEGSSSTMFLHHP